MSMFGLQGREPFGCDHLGRLGDREILARRAARQLDRLSPPDGQPPRARDAERDALLSLGPVFVVLVSSLWMFGTEAALEPGDGAAIGDRQPVGLGLGRRDLHKQPHVAPADRAGKKGIAGLR
jgi:hypothetical protein